MATGDVVFSPRRSTAFIHRKRQVYRPMRFHLRSSVSLTSPRVCTTSAPRRRSHQLCARPSQRRTLRRCPPVASAERHHVALRRPQRMPVRLRCPKCRTDRVIVRGRSISARTSTPASHQMVVAVSSVFRRPHSPPWLVRPHREGVVPPRRRRWEEVVAEASAEEEE